MKTSRKMVRIPRAVNTAISNIAQTRRMDPADLMADILSFFTIDQKILENDAASQISAEIDLKEKVRHLAQAICADKFDSHVTWRIFHHIRTDPKLRSLYEKVIGDEGFAHGNETKARINRSLGTIIKVSVGGEARTENGLCLAVRVQDEFILSYTPLKPIPDTGKRELQNDAVAKSGGGVGPEFSRYDSGDIQQEDWKKTGTLG